MVLRPTRPSRFQKGQVPARPGTRPVPVLRPASTPTPPPAQAARAPQPPPNADDPQGPGIEDMAPPLIAAPDETDTGSIPIARPTRPGGPRPVGQAPAPKPEAQSTNLRNLEALLQESKTALRDRDEALAKAAALETRVDELSAIASRASEQQDQLAAVMAERDRNAEALAEAQQQVEALKPLEAAVADLKSKLAASERTRTKLAQEHARMKARIASVEGQQKELMEHLKASETKRRKAETALANAKETRNEYLYRLQAVQAISQGEAPPSRSQVTAEAEKQDEEKDGA